MPRMPIQGPSVASAVNPRLRRAFPRIDVGPVLLNPQDDRMAAILAAFQSMFGEPEAPLDDTSLLRAQALAARQPIEEYDELGTLPVELRGMNPLAPGLRGAVRRAAPRPRGNSALGRTVRSVARQARRPLGLRYFGG